MGLQPSRGYDIDPKATYHAPDLVPPHHYLAFYLWLREEFGVYLIRSGRICVAGLNTGNVERTAQAMAAVMA